MNTPFEKRVCYTLCCCELTAVLSCVSIFYLTFAVYLPSYRQLTAGFSQQTVMCTTKSNLTFENCELLGKAGWGSCGEWCLSKSGGPCTQIRVDVRQNGTNILLEECDPDMEDVVYCDGIDPKQETKECITGGCRDLTGLYNCSLHPVSEGVTESTIGARCRDVTNVLSCNMTSVDPEQHCKTKKACVGLNGLYICRKGHCSRIRPPFKCDRTCTGIKTGGKTVVVRENNVIFTASCKRAIDINTNEEIWPRNLLEFSSSNDTMTTTTTTTASTTINAAPPILLIFCTAIPDRQMNMTEIRLQDCFNGTLLDPDYFGEMTDIGHLVHTHVANPRLLDPTGRFAPPESDLVMLSDAPLYINYEACVNTLILRECEKFYADYGVTGSDLRTNARFPCYYRPNFTAEEADEHDNFVIIRFDIERAMAELFFASVIPITLAVISCFMLVLCSKVIHVDNESHFFFKACGKTYLPPIPPSDGKEKI